MDETFSQDTEKFIQFNILIPIEGTYKCTENYSPILNI
jgi:hypothetical protein